MYVTCTEMLYNSWKYLQLQIFAVINLKFDNLAKFDSDNWPISRLYEYNVFYLTM